jgi:hypothetical protein
MLDQENAAVTELGCIEVCYVRSRRARPWGSYVVYEVVGLCGQYLQVVAASRPIPGEGDAATATLLRFDQHLQRHGWRQEGEPRTTGEYCYTRPAGQAVR